MEAHFSPKQPIQVNKVTSSCKIYSGPHDTQYCMENLEQAFVDYASSRIDEVGEEEIMEPSLTKDRDRNIRVKKEEGAEKRREEFDEDIKDEETKEETEEEEEYEPKYFYIPPTTEELSYHE
uniref:MAK10-like protein n=1 Tax=Tanacetum cinerariifolium TaxID=118510 RepID=A0A699JXG7_TANCI|nr:MAK10-like protein [Tanacetum cinerariifolium]